MAAKATKHPATPLAVTPGQQAVSGLQVLFNQPEFVEDRRKREVERQEKLAVLMKQYGSVAAIFADTPREAALRMAIVPFLKGSQFPDEIEGWSFLHLAVPEAIRDAVTKAWPLPTNVADAWAEFQDQERLNHQRYVADTYFDPYRWVEARQRIIEGLLDTLPARNRRDMLARVSWLTLLFEQDRDGRSEQHGLLARLKADVSELVADLVIDQ